ncbi:hypothetical protein RY831_22005 [Noviherbaspirillum sp. CPCC 100848]|uniref:Uncharacterized protein n=1 Tax=Noviherbaspirillum album TaxID=3080276 RepID=A0ABU6JE80_9BURK|nr:hypothetical protein [Noviherbaspirillum sp. CPCC 100848]MEC4721845.1 hypothetical protein [Noviherbaspirillum sp. CPCC 100848]
MLPPGRETDLDVIRKTLQREYTPVEKREFLLDTLERLRNEPNKDETKTNLTPLLQDYFDKKLSSEGRGELENILGINLDALNSRPIKMLEPDPILL